MDETEKQQKKRDLQLLRQTVVRNVATGRIIKLGRFGPSIEDQLVQNIDKLEEDIKRIDDLTKNIEEWKGKDAEQRWVEYELQQVKPDIEKLLAYLAKLRGLLDQFQKEEIIRVKDFSEIKSFVKYIDEKKMLLTQMQQSPRDEKNIIPLRQNINDALERIKAYTQMAQRFENREAMTLVNFLKTETEIQQLIALCGRITTNTLNALNQMTGGNTELLTKSASVNTAMTASLEELRQKITTQQTEVGRLAQLLGEQKNKELQLRGEANNHQQHIKTGSTVDVRQLDVIVGTLNTIITELESGEQAIAGIIGTLRTDFGALTPAIQNLEKELQELQDLIEPKKKGFLAGIFNRSK